VFVKMGHRIVGEGKLRLPVLFALAIAFSALWLVFTFILNYWATNKRQEDLSALVEQVDDQLYRKGEDIRYQLLSSASLLASQDETIRAISLNDRQLLWDDVKNFYRTYSSQALVNQVQIFDQNGELLSNLGTSNLTNHSVLSPQELIVKTDATTGLHIKNNGDIEIFAVVQIINNKQLLGYVQVSKPLTELVNELADLNKVTLFLLAEKSLVSEAEAQNYQASLGLKSRWHIFKDLVLCTHNQGNINLESIAPIVDSAVENSDQNSKFLRDKLSINSKRMNLGLLPVHDSDGNYIGRLLLLKDISDEYASYQISLLITSISFGVIISLIFVSFWFFLGRIEKGIASAEQDLIETKNLAEQARDEAEQAKLQAEDANKIKSEFLAKMSHELRTPLNAIIGITEMMAEDAEEFADDDYIEPMGRVLRSGKHLLALINDILDLSKIEAGKMELHPECFDINLFIGDINRTCEPLASKNKNNLEVKMRANLGDIYTDSTRLKQVLLNLLSNACKFTNDGSVQLYVDHCNVDDKPGVQFSIIDTGIGMTNEQLAMLFQDFQQVDSSATRKYEGTGLGLSISQKLANLMGGNIIVNSTQGVGSEFIFKLPLNNSNVEMDLQGQQQNLRSSMVDNEDLENLQKHVLVVEDDDNMVQLLKHHFDKINIRVVVAKDGNQALQMARSEIPDLITLDINMPNLNGWDTLAAMRADEVLKSVPIVVVTVQEEKRKGMELGASDYLTKPINKDDVISMVNRYTGVGS